MHVVVIACLENLHHAHEGMHQQQSVLSCLTADSRSTSTQAIVIWTESYMLGSHDGIPTRLSRQWRVYQW